MAGKFFDELAPDQVYKHQPGRTVTEADSLLFTALSMNTQPLHLDAEFARQTEVGQRLVSSLFTLSTLVGLSVAEEWQPAPGCAHGARDG